MVQRRWNWPGPNGKPVYNFRNDGRAFTEGRCLIVADGFYEFTMLQDPRKKRKDRWLFTMAGEPHFWIVGIWRQVRGGAEAFIMLTMEPEPDIAPYHDWQMVLLEQHDWADWLGSGIASKDIIRALPAGSLAVVQVG